MMGLSTSELQPKTVNTFNFNIVQLDIKSFNRGEMMPRELVTHTTATMALYIYNSPAVNP